MRFYHKFFYLCLIILQTGCISQNIPNDHRYSFREKMLPEYLFEMVDKYAPVIFQQIKESKQLHDFIVPFDFDNDYLGCNNEENLLAENGNFEASVYFSILETETHFFITYSFFHPLDWNTISPLIPYSWHENDMESIQIVIQKSPKERIILLAAQAHLSTNFHSDRRSSISSNLIKTESIQLFNNDGYSNSDSTHCGIYIESGGHAIYSSSDLSKDFLKNHDYILFTPGGRFGDLFSIDKEKYQYKLIWIYNSFWKLFSLGTNSGNGKLFNGTFNYTDEFFNFKNLPRHFDSDRISGPFKTNSGIIPFSFSFNLLSLDLGVLFFNPAKKYNNEMNISSAWSRNYLYNPYIE